MLRKIKLKILSIVYNQIKYIKLPISSKRLLIVRLDAIGDYILFRNFIYEIKKSKKYSEYSFSLLGNISFKDLAEFFEKDIIDKFYFINIQDINGILSSNLYQRLKLIFKFKIKRFDILINPVHSRLLSFDLFFKELGAKEMIASTGDLVRFSSVEQYNVSSKVYSSLIKVPDEQNFEYYRNQVFCNNLLGTHVKVDIILNIPDTTYKYLTKPTIIIVPGAGANFRRWNPKNFSIFVDNIMRAYNNIFQFIILGPLNEKNLASEVIQYSEYPEYIIDYTGKTNLVEMVYLIKEAEFLISNETSAVHIAASVKTPTVCISNGNHFGRFNPYPKDVFQYITTVYPSNIFYDSSKRQKLISMTRIKSEININEIKPSDVFRHFLELANSISIHKKQ
jgi:ADP-heptose:LPS heptosyltransferase